MYGKSEDSRDYQQTPGPVAVMAADYPDGSLVPPHRHRRGQLIYSCSGVMAIAASQGHWVVPPCRGIWMPPGVEHSIRMSGHVGMRTAYVEPGASRSLPDAPSVVEVSPLLRELIVRAARLPHDYMTDSHAGRVAALILDEIRAMPVKPLHLPMPQDHRAAKVCLDLLDDPSLILTLEQWGRRVGVSGRTLARLFLGETGITFSVWRQQARLLGGLERLARGESVLRAALAVGYDSPSAFSAMFRRALGVPPSDYFGRGD
jgi:AraC-like DNA-binding protein